jgi:hypothetical protein
VHTGIKRVGTSAQVDNEKMGATAIIGCEFQMSTNLWCKVDADGNAICLVFGFIFLFNFHFIPPSLLSIGYFQ